MAIGVVAGWLALSMPANAARPCSFAGTKEPSASKADPSGRVRFLTDVRAGAHRCFDRAVFQFRPSDGTAPGYRIAYEEPPIREDGSSRRSDVAGNAYLVVRLAPARDTEVSDGSQEPTYRGPESVAAPGSTRIVEVRHVSSFEGTLKWAIGLDRPRPYRVTRLSSPPRLVVDVG